SHRRRAARRRHPHRRRATRRRQAIAAPARTALMSPLGDFSPQALAYAARPAYPDALIDRLCARAQVAAGDRVADLGAGTGIFTAQLAARSFLVDAIDPNPQMRAQAPALPGVTWRDGTFESTGLADHAVRWVTAAQAFH